MVITMEETTAKLFRLRNESQIVGYMRFVDKGKPFFSKDRFWWGSTKIDYSSKDSFAELKDMNQQAIFEGDIIEMKLKTSVDFIKQAVIIYDEDRLDFVAVRCDSYQPIKRKDWKDYKIKHISYLFINKELEEDLRERKWLQ
ncbi:hypothetical protein DID78_03545 [Candidatus Marinamargulisbacteria bacterium SCGC AG-343-D04]|nr:hypothetical protein DID78_03545 [Candidatus Marinamargulisbacteria bacterium SCGC AG-343-D04]